MARKNTEPDRSFKDGLKDFITDPAGIASMVFVGAIAGFAGVIAVGIQQMEPDPPQSNIVDELYQDIINPAVGAEELRRKGYFTKGEGLRFLDECRNQYLTEEFSEQAAPRELAEMITACIFNKAAAQHHETAEGARWALETYGTAPIKIADTVMHELTERAHNVGKTLLGGEDTQNAEEEEQHQTPPQESDAPQHADEPQEIAEPQERPAPEQESTPKPEPQQTPETRATPEPQEISEPQETAEPQHAPEMRPIPEPPPRPVKPVPPPGFSGGR
ncbi:MAG: hypothetical protein EA357_04450 [Micavibrio sp.]|nr:MAG: hypothetical protein EA357_04450 [Micavibrio sp.]